MKTSDSCFKEKGKKPCVLLLDQQGAVVNKNSKALFASRCISR